MGVEVSDPGLRDALLVAAGYLLGSLPWGLWLPRLVAGVDVRTLGSGNIGATNVWRTLGFKLGLAVAPLATLSAAAVWIVVFLVTRYASVASMAAAASLPLFALLFGASWPVLAFTAGGAVAIVLLHRTNIARLVRGQENRIKLRRRTAASL